MRRSISAAIVFVIFSHANAQTSLPDQQRWLCVADASTGYSFDAESNRWRPTHFRTETKLIIRRPDENDMLRIRRILLDKDHPKWVISEVGSSSAKGYCFDEFHNDVLTCTVFLGSLKFNRKLHRFINTVDFGYVKPASIEGADTPYMEIGRCSAF